MSTAVDTAWEFSHAEIGVLAVVVATDTLLDDLGITPVPRADRRAALAALEGRGVVDDDEVSDLALVGLLQALAAPAVTYTARHPASGFLAVLATGGEHSVLAECVADSVTLRPVWAPDAGAAARVLRGVLDRAGGTATPADVPVARFPLEPLAERLRACHDATDLTAAFASGGLSPREAALLAAAVSSARRRTEIVARVRVDGLPTTSVGAVAVLDGPAGRVIAGPDLSVDGTPWTTFSPGTGLRLEQALGRLVATVPGADVPQYPESGTRRVTARREMHRADRPGDRPGDTTP